MDQPDPDEERMEELKTMLEFDEQIAKLYGLTKATVRDEYDPTLVKLMVEFLRSRR
jgi:hypothetical protein